MKLARLFILTLAFLLASAAGSDAPVSVDADEGQIVQAQLADDGVQYATLRAGSYFFSPARLIVRVNIPVALTVSREQGVVPHDFVLHAPEAGILVEEELGNEATTIRFTPTATGAFDFYCSKRFLLFRSHRQRGMEGMLQVVE